MWAIQIQQDLHMPSIRQAVIQDIQHLIQQNREHTTDWHTFLPTHCRIAYQQPEMITQIPILISLLERIHYPHTHTHPTTGAQRWIPTTGTTTTRTTMARQVGQQIHRTTFHRRPTNLQPGLHHQEITTPKRR